MQVVHERRCGLDVHKKKCRDRGPMRPYAAHIESLQRIQGTGRRSVEAILADGEEMRYWPTDDAIASWAKICPGNNESEGKRRSTCIGRGNQSLRSALVEPHLRPSGSRTRTSQPSTIGWRPDGGAKRAIIAVAHAILIVIYHMLKDGTVYREVGGDYFERVDREAILRRSARRIEKLGY